MLSRSPYSVLGISPAASSRDIRAAFRAMALRHHPDVGGHSDSRPFVEVRQAYEALRDPATRRAWDESRLPTAALFDRVRFASPVVTLGSSYAEARHARTVAPALAIALSSLEDWFGTLLDSVDLRSAGFAHEGRAHELERLFYDLVLTPDEAARGGRFSFSIPLRRRDGEVVEPDVHVVVPPGVRDGQRATLPLVGLARGQVTVTVRLD